MKDGGGAFTKVASDSQARRSQTPARTPSLARAMVWTSGALSTGESRLRLSRGGRGPCAHSFCSADSFGEQWNIRVNQQINRASY